jgi:hypothetical protein
MPTSVKLALTGVWVQVLFNGLGGFFLMAEVSNRLDHGQDIGLMRPLAYISLVVAAVLASCAILALKRYGWVRNVMLVIEALAVVSALAGMFGTGTFSFLLGLALAVAIAAGLTGEGRKWFDH